MAKSSPPFFEARIVSHARHKASQKRLRSQHSGLLCCYRSKIGAVTIFGTLAAPGVRTQSKRHSPDDRIQMVHTYLGKRIDTDPPNWGNWNRYSKRRDGRRDRLNSREAAAECSPTAKQAAEKLVGRCGFEGARFSRAVNRSKRSHGAAESRAPSNPTCQLGVFPQPRKPGGKWGKNEPGWGKRLPPQRSKVNGTRPATSLTE